MARLEPDNRAPKPPKRLEKPRIDEARAFLAPRDRFARLRLLLTNHGNAGAQEPAMGALVRGENDVEVGGARQELKARLCITA